MNNSKIKLVISNKSGFLRVNLAQALLDSRLAPFLCLTLCLFVAMLLSACAASETTNTNVSPVSPAASTSAAICQVTEPVWLKPPEDAAVGGPPTYGHYFVNQDHSILASVWWAEEESTVPLREDGFKVGWFRPAGATLEITGQRVDGESPPLKADIPCCYPTQFQATGLTFPTAGCWQVTAKAADRELSFTVKVDP